VLAQSSLIYVALRLTAEHVEVEAPEPIRSRWVPTSTTRPWSITAILSACLAGAGGVTISAILPAVIRLRVIRMPCSALASRAAVMGP
jgi:hypothetical protein